MAGASSDCDTLKDELNNKRGADLSVENDAKLFVIERLLQNLNKGQGLGFVVAGKVLDRTTLKTIFVAVSSFLGTVVPVVLALRPTTAVAGTAACSLPAYHRDAIRAVMASANATCSYNVSLSAILA